MLRCKEVLWGGYHDTELPMNRELIQVIEARLGQIKPSLIFVHHLEDTHQDHRHLAMATITASRNGRNILFYEGPTSLNFSPSVFVDITLALNDKKNSLEAHASQISKTNINGTSIIDLASSTAQFRGIQARVTYAEGFVPLRVFLDSFEKNAG